MEVNRLPWSSWPAGLRIPLKGLLTHLGLLLKEFETMVVALGSWIVYIVKVVNGS